MVWKVKLTEEDVEVKRRELMRGKAKMSDMSPRDIKALKQRRLEEKRALKENRKKGKSENSEEKVKKGFPWLRIIIFLAIIAGLYYYFKIR